MHYVDEGPAGAETVLLLHGQPTWSFLYRTVVARLVEHGLRAVAPDLIGFGRSDKPLARAAHTIGPTSTGSPSSPTPPGLRGITLVVQDWGGPLGLSLLDARRPGLARRVVAANTVLHTADAGLAGRLEWPCHAAADGTVTVAQMLLDYQRLTQEVAPFRPSLFVQGATESERARRRAGGLRRALPRRGLLRRAAPAAAAHGPHAVERLCPPEPAHHGRARPASTARSLTAFSDGDPRHPRLGRGAAAHVPGAAGPGHVTIAGAGHFLQEDRGEALADVVAQLVEDDPLRLS